MRKIVTVATAVAVLGGGIGLVTYSLIRTGGQVGSIDFPAAAPREQPAHLHEPRAEEPSETPRAAVVPAAAAADVAIDPAADGLSADERSPFGHAGNEQIQPDHETTIAEGPAAEPAGDATSLAPLLTDAHATIAQLLADADGDPEAKAELTALIGDGTPFEALLDDPDPAVREQAAKLLEVLGRATPQ